MTVANVALFSYGTLQLEEVQQSSFGRLLKGRADALVGFSQTMLEITDPEVVATSGQRYHPVVAYTGNPNDTVPGCVFAITAEELAHADAYEVDDYERIETTLASGTQAWVYVMANREA